MVKEWGSGQGSEQRESRAGFGDGLALKRASISGSIVDGRHQSQRKGWEEKGGERRDGSRNQAGPQDSAPHGCLVVVVVVLLLHGCMTGGWWAGLGWAPGRDVV